MGARSRIVAVERMEARSMGAAATVETATRGAIDALRRASELREPDQVCEYLATHPDLLDLLDEAAMKSPTFLPPDGRIMLEMLRDPEDEGDAGEPFAIIPTRLRREEVWPRLDRLDRVWLVAAGRYAAGRFDVDVEYR